MMSLEQDVRECYQKVSTRAEAIAEHFKDIEEEINKMLNDLLELLDKLKKEGKNHVQTQG